MWVGNGVGNWPLMLTTHLRPALNLQFSQGKLDSKITFTRATTATVTDWEGLIKNTKSGEARFDGMRRVENLLTYSQDFSNAVWTKSGGTVTTASNTAPDGTLTAQFFYEDTVNTEHRLRVANITKTSNQVLILSAYVKPFGRYITLGMEFAGIGLYSNFDVLNNQFIDAVPGSGWTRGASGIGSVGNGWYRIYISGTTDTNTTVNTRIQLANTYNSVAPQVYTGDGTSGIYIWGAQFENVTGQTNQNPSEYVSTNAIRRNLLTYTEQFDNAVWNKTLATITANTVVAPDGTLTADLITATGTGVFTYQSLAVTGAYTWSIYLKAGTTNFCYLSIGNTPTFRVWVNLATGALGSTAGSPTSTSIQNVGNGWYRVTITATTTVSPTLGYISLASADNTLGCNIGDSIYIWGAQLEVGSTASAYQVITNAGPQDFNNYQGASVDGVQYFPYTNPNCIINGVITQIPTIAINSSKSKFAYNCVASGDYFSTPSATANQITGDISMLVQVALDDWTPATVQTLVAKDGVTSQRSYAFNVQTSGALRLNYSLDGSTITSITSTVSTGFTDGTVHFVGVQREAATGIVRFYTSENGTTFTQLGTDQTGTAGNLFNSTTAVQFGNLSSLAFELNGKIYDSHIYTGLKFSGNTLGSELVTNGNFSNGTTNWVESGAGGSVSLANGVVTIVTTGVATKILTQTITGLTAGAVYRISYDITGANARIGNGAGYYGIGTNNPTNVVFVAASTSVSIQLTNTAADTGTFDNISMIQITPNTATASSTMVVDFDPSDWTSGTTWVGPETGETWTINGNAKVYQGLWDAVGPKSLLIEEARTNLLTQSQDFSNVAWSKENVTVSAITTVLPDGTSNANKVIDTAVLGFHRVYSGLISGISAVPYTFSVYAKYAGRRWLALQISGSTYFDLLNGVVGSSTSGSTGTITPVGNGWYRCTTTRTLPAGSATTEIFLANADNGANYTGDGTSGVYLWGAQLEAGAFATSYIPTTSAQVTRNADQASMTGTNFSSWYNASAGTFYVEGDYLASPSSITVGSADGTFINATDATVSNNMALVRGHSGPFTPKFYINNGGANVFNTPVGTTWVANTMGKLIGAYATNNGAECFNGGTIVSTATLSVPTVNTLYIGYFSPTLGALDGHIRTIRYYNQRFSNSTLRLMTGLYSLNPLTWFTDGSQGAWYDPSTMSTLFQDSAGTTPVTAVEQPVGLMLDRSKGLVLGSELVTNGDFSQGTTGWSVVNGSIVVNSGVATITNTGAVEASLTIQNLTPNSWFYISADISALNLTGTVYFVTPAGSNVSNIPRSGAGKLQGYFSSGTTGTGIRIAVGQPVLGASFSVDNISIKQLPGNHAFQATAGNRPTLSARVNLLQGTDNCDPSNGWTRNTTGGNTFTNFSSGSPTNSSYVQVSIGTGPFGPAPLAYNINVIAGVTYNVTLATQKISGSVSSLTVVFNDGATTVPVNSAWTTTTIQITPATTGAVQVRIDRNSTLNAGCVYNIANVDVRPANIGANLPTYQRVSSPTDYDTTGFPLYLNCNGTSTAMATNSIDFSATDKMTVVAGVRKLSDTIEAVVAELSTNWVTNTGSFFFAAPSGTINDFTYISKGTTAVGAGSGVLLAPTSKVLTGQSAISTPLVNLRVNGAQAATSSASQGTGNYGNYPLYLFARSGNQAWFTGYFYGLIVNGKSRTVDEINAAEYYMSTKTGLSF